MMSLCAAPGRGSYLDGYAVAHRRSRKGANLISYLSFPGHWQALQSLQLRPSAIESEVSFRGLVKPPSPPDMGAKLSFAPEPEVGFDEGADPFRRSKAHPP